MVNLCQNGAWWSLWKYCNGVLIKHCSKVLSCYGPKISLVNALSEVMKISHTSRYGFLSDLKQITNLWNMYKDTLYDKLLNWPHTEIGIDKKYIFSLPFSFFGAIFKLKKKKRRRWSQTTSWISIGPNVHHSCLHLTMSINSIPCIQSMTIDWIVVCCWK